MGEPKDAHIDRALSNISIKYSNENFIWTEVMPMVKVEKRSNKFFKYQKDEYFRIPDDKISPKGYANQASLKKVQDNYSVEDHALEDFVAQEEVDNADAPLSPLADTNEFLLEQLHLAQENRVAALVFAAATYPTGNKVQLSGTGQWGGSADDPIGDIMTGLDAAFQRPNTITFGGEAWTKFRQLPEILDAVKSTSRHQGSPGGLAGRDEVASLFEVEKILVGRSLYNTAKEGQAAAFSRLWGKHCALLYVKKNPTIKSITFGLTLHEQDFKTFRGFDARMGVKGAHWIKPSWNSDEKIIASDVGYLIEDATA